MGRTSFLSSLWSLLAPSSPREAQAMENLSWLLDRGIPPDQALASAMGTGKAGPPLLVPGEKIGSALFKARWTDPGEAAFLEALEEVGKLPQGLWSLARFRRERHQALRAALGKMAYPLLVLHLALVPLQIPTLLSRGFGPALTSFLLWWAGLDLLLFLLSQGIRKAWRKGTLEKWPLIGPWFLLGEKRKALFLLGELHGAGILWDRALELASRSVRARSLATGLSQGLQDLSRGIPPSLVLVQSLRLEGTCAGLLHSGEKAGRLQESLGDCGKALEGLSQRNAKLLAGTAGAALYALAVAATVLVLLRALIAIYSAPFQLP